MELLNINASKKECAVLEGINNAISRGWLKDLPDGDHYGELIGEIFNGNQHKVIGHLFVPFAYLKKHCFWKSWSQRRYPRNYNSISRWFEELPSLFNQRMKLDDIRAEGLVFYRKNGTMAKLRRDMFDWHQGKKHNI